MEGLCFGRGPFADLLREVSLLRMVSGTAWDYIWEPLDEYGHPIWLTLAEPFEFRPGGCCAECGSTNIRGLRILLNTRADFFSPESEDLDRDQAMIVMACATWHEFFIVSSLPDEVERYMMKIRKVNGDSGYTDGDIRDGLSDRWFRIMSPIARMPAVRAAFGAVRPRNLFGQNSIYLLESLGL